MLSSRPFLRPVCWLVLTALGLQSGLAIARPAPTEAEITQARERFGEARRLEDAGRWLDALTLLQRVAEVKTTPQVRFHIALCLENIGLWTDALDGYAQVIDEAKGNAPEVLKEANEHIRKLEGSMSTLTLRVNGAAAGDELFLDRRALPIDNHALAMRAAPGPHSAEVRRGGTVVARELFTLDPRATRRVELKVGSVAEKPPGWVGPPEVPGLTGPPPPPPSDGSTQRTLGYTALGLSGASAIAMGVFIGLRGGALDRLQAACPSMTGCPASVEIIVNQGKTDAALVNVFGVLTGLAAGGGGVLLITAPHAPAGPPASAPPASLTLSPAIGRGTAGIFLEGAF